MPTDPSKRVQQILELPPGLTLDQLETTLNDRIRDINAAFGNAVQNPALGDVDLGTHEIINLADPKNDLDGVNLRTLKKYSGTAVPEQVAGGTGSGVEQPTIYFEFDSAPFDGEESPFAIIMANRDGFTPTAVSFAAVGAPTSAPAQVNLTIDDVDMLTDNLALPVGEQGAVFTSLFAKAGPLPEGTKIKAVVVIAGGSTQITIGLSLRGVS